MLSGVTKGKGGRIKVSPLGAQSEPQNLQNIRSEINRRRQTVSLLISNNFIQNRKPGPVGQVRVDRLCHRSNLFMVSGFRTGKVSGVRFQVSAIMSVISEALTLKYGVSTRALFQTL